MSSNELESSIFFAFLISFVAFISPSPFCKKVTFKGCRENKWQFVFAQTWVVWFFGVGKTKLEMRQFVWKAELNQAQMSDGICKFITSGWISNAYSEVCLDQWHS